MPRMEGKLIALAIPVFFLLIALELWLAQRRAQRGSGPAQTPGGPIYRLNDAATDLACGMSQQALGIFLNVALASGYAWVNARSPWLMAESDALAWVVAFVGVDFCYYWWHRLSHEVNVLWAVHVVHHHSQDYNLAVALRQALFSSATSWPFYAPLAFIGVPVAVLLTIIAISTLYQFWIHTRLVGRLGFLEGLLNTPSAHRVHHGINPQYIDRNHGAIFIVWDRLFGTYEPEGQEVVYGTVTPHESWNPVWANFEYFAKLIALARRAPRWFDKLQVWLRAPGWMPAGLGPHEVPPPVDARVFVKFDRAYPPGIGAYVIAQFVPAVVATFCVLWFSAELSLAARLALVLFLFVSGVSFGALFEQRRFAVALELARLLATACAVVVLVGGEGGAVAPAALGVGLCLLSAASFVWMSSKARQPSAA